MSEQAKALELAHLIEQFDAADLELPLDEMAPVAAELRRLHSVNAELLEALRGLLNALPSATTHPAIATARAAIAKAEGERK